MFSLTTYFIFFIASVLTSALSALIGMAGGVTLLSLLTFFIALPELIPIHGAAQLISNSGRAFLLRSHIKRPLILWFLLGLPLGNLAAIYLIKKVSSPTLPLLLIALLIFYVVFRPKKLPSLSLPLWGFSVVGFFVGLLGPLVGATGPFLAVFFVRDDFKKETIIATKACVQMLGHLAKIPTFLYLGFHYQDYALVIFILGLGAIIGTQFGVLWLKKLPENLFKILFKSALFIAALRLLYKVLI